MSNSAPLQIDYTSRDYDSLRSDLVNLIRARTGLNWTADDPNDIGVALLESFAYMGDVANYYIDRAANETFIDTATQRQTLLNLASLFDYRPSGPTPASVSVTFTNNGTAALDLPIGTQVVAPLQYGDYSEVFFETTTAVTQLAPNTSVSVACKEGKTANTDRPGLIDPSTHLALPVSLGTSTGLPNITLSLPDTGIVDGSVQAFVGQGEAFNEWAWVDSIIEWGPYDQVFTTKVNADGSTSVVFGDGVNGSIPASQQLISSAYRTSAGAAGNISAGQVAEVSFIPGNTNANAPAYLTVTNSVAAVGGADADDNTQIRNKLKKSISARRRAVTLTDYEALSLLVPTVGRAKAVSGTYSSISLYIQPQNDGTISPGLDPGTRAMTTGMLQLVDSVKAYFADKTPVGTTLTILPPTYVDLDIALNVAVGSAYLQSDVVKAVSAALMDPARGLYSYYSYDFGATVSLSDLIVAAASVPGVVAITVVNLTRHATTPGATDIYLAANELPRLQATNLTLNPIGGLLLA